MHNSYWYYALLALSTSLFIFILVKKRNTQSLYLLLTMIGLAFIIETVIYNFLASYDYNPNFIKHNNFYDNNLGAFVSNAFSLPIIATFIAVFGLNWIWIIFFSGFFVGVEWLFLKLHIYSHNWWRLAYTGLGLPFYFATAKSYYKWILQPANGFKHYWILYLITCTISASAYILPIIFFSNRIYSPGWFENSGRDSIAFSAIFYLCVSLFYCLMTKFNLKRNWIKYIFTALLMFVLNQVLMGTGILRSLVWWDQPYYAVISVLTLLLTGTIDKRLNKLTIV
ncbi:hypothetical protein [Neobacillus drentensis]|uniref:hypothetical protein n=1 Tax=Neobacillus drentensis TaxID=220684 RepID=UPI003001C132